MAEKKKPAAKKSAAKSTAKKPATKEAATKKSATKSKPATKGKATDKKAAAKTPAVKKPAAKQPAAKKPSAKQSVPKAAAAQAAEGGEQAGAKLEMSASRQFNGWLQENRISLGFTTYQSGKVFLVGLQQNGRLSIFERTFNRCMGLCVDGQRLYMSSLYQLWRFQNVLQPGQAHEGYDRVYVPITGYTTGDLDVHDIAVDNDGRIVFINTLFGCIATLSESESFTPLWQPPFISKIAAEDRCHLNGLAMENGRPRYVTAIGETDVPDGWREHRQAGGVVIDVQANEVLARGLSMPHSPRVYRDKLYIVNSGTGEFGSIDRKTGDFQPIAFCPGYLRGMSFHGDYAIVGLSKPRKDGTFSGLALDDALAEKNAEAQCALYIIDLRSGDIVHWLRIDGVVKELYDVVFIPDVVRPMALGFKSDEIRRTITVGEMGSL